MRKNITQKPMSLKINIETLAKLNEYCEESGYSKNGVINKAIDYYLGTTM